MLIVEERNVASGRVSYRLRDKKGIHLDAFLLASRGD